MAFLGLISSPPAPPQVRPDRHARPDRSVHVVGVRQHHHGGSGASVRPPARPRAARFRRLTRPFCARQASSFPCVVVYVMDTSRSVSPVTFMSNMLYACRSGKPPPPPFGLAAVGDVLGCPSLSLQHPLQDQAPLHRAHEQSEFRPGSSLPRTRQSFSPQPLDCVRPADGTARRRGR